jgi:hypothetical protein
MHLYLFMSKYITKEIYQKSETTSNLRQRDIVDMCIGLIYQL